MGLSPIARKLRRDATDIERILWSRLRNRQLLGVKFRRQMPIEGYVADFGSLEAKVIVELDGSQHLDMQRADASRTRAIEAAGFVVLRFWNNDVNDNIDGVLTEIAAAIRHRLPDR
jgi:very-short-patch-repair endonuclease